MNNKTELLNNLEEVVEPYLNSTGLECDGMSRVLSYLLGQKGIIHSIQAGFVSTPQYKENLIDPHYWIEVEEYDSPPIPHVTPSDRTYVIDLRATIWLPDTPDVLHGIATREELEAKGFWYNRVWNKRAAGRTMYEILRRDLVM